MVSTPVNLILILDWKTYYNFQLDVIFGSQILRLASVVNCQAEILIRSVLQNHDPTLLKHGGHQHFVCLLRSHEHTHEERILEDFEIVETKNEKEFLEIRQCPLKYEFLRRPMLVFPKQVAFIYSPNYSLDQHEQQVEECLKTCDHKLRLRGKLSWTFVTRKRDQLRWQRADFLLKNDTKLGGVLMYNTTSQPKVSDTENCNSISSGARVGKLTTWIFREKSKNKQIILKLKSLNFSGKNQKI